MPTMRWRYCLLLVVLVVLVGGAGVGAFDMEGASGFYDFVPGCVASQTCCCATGPAYVTPVYSSSESESGFAVNITGESGGGAGCLFQTRIGGALDVSSEYRADSVIPGVDIGVTARWENDTSPAYKEFALFSSVTDCAIRFTAHYGDTEPTVSAVSMSVSQPSGVDSSSSSVFTGSVLTCSYAYSDSDGDTDESRVVFVNENQGRNLATSTSAPHVYTVLPGDASAGDSITCVVKPYNNYYFPSSSADYESSAAQSVQAGAGCDRTDFFSDFSALTGDCNEAAAHGTCLQLIAMCVCVFVRVCVSGL
jgi:hypothetical protein